MHKIIYERTKIFENASKPVAILLQKRITLTFIFTSYLKTLQIMKKEKMLSFHGKQEIKEEYLKRLQLHHDAEK